MSGFLYFLVLSYIGVGLFIAIAGLVVSTIDEELRELSVWDRVRVATSLIFTWPYVCWQAIQKVKKDGL